MAISFQLDLPTLFAVLAIINIAGLFFSIILFISRQVFAGARWWIVGQAAIVIASATVLLRDITHPLIGIVLPNCIYLFSGLAFLSSVWHFRNHKKMPWPIWLILPLSALIFILTLGESINLRIIIFSVILILIGWTCALLLFIGIPKNLRLPSYLLGATFFVTGLIQLLRLPDAIFGPTITVFQQQTLTSSILYLISILSAFALLFGYFLLSSVRLATELRLKEEAIQRKNHELEDLNNTKGLLLSVIAHDLQAPIVSASRYVQNFLLPKEINLEEKQKAIAILGITLTKASKLLADLLLWADNPNTMEFEPTPIDSMVRTARDLIDSEFQAKNITLIDQSSSRQILADRQSILTILRNLLSNALKFTVPGNQVRIWDEETDDQIIISVSDTGIGIDPENLELLRKGKSIITTTGTYGEYGNGIGLLLCRRLVQRHGGTLEITSCKGKGTTFSLHFPKTSAQ